MKNLPLFIGMLLLSLLFTGCGDDGFLDDLFDRDEHVAIEDLPEAILDYIAENYPDSTIEEAEREKNRHGDIIYEVELDTGEELTFDEAGNFLGVEEDDD